MPAFPRPRFSYTYDVAAEIRALRSYRRTKLGRAIPARTTNRLLLASWNVANLGLQKRRDKDYRLIAEMVKWFDLVAMQEINDNLSGLRAIHQYLLPSYRVLFSDKAGNNERLGFFYRHRKVKLLEKVGELAIPPSAQRFIKFSNVRQKFRGFDRNPYLAAFRAGSFTFLLANVHLFFGDEKAVSVNRRSLETFAVARWANLRRRSKNSFTRDIIPLGDFNLPQTNSRDPIFRALRSRGLHLPTHSGAVGSSIAKDKHYDQIAFFPGETRQDFTGNSGIFDFDGALFRSLWKKRKQKGLLAYLRYYISDHRILWAEFRI